jgi:hypothetical protein
MQSRITAFVIAVAALAGLVVQFAVSYSLCGSMSATLWTLIAYFTITTNVIVAAVFTAIAVNRTALRSSWVVAGTMLSIVLVGVIYGFLLHGLVELSGGSQVANVLLHDVAPVLVPIFWVFFTPKGRLTWRDHWKWALYPLFYLAYALVRGAMTSSYAYPFMNVAVIGWRQTAINSAAIAAAFLLSAFAIVWMDQWLGGRATSRERVVD